MSGIQNLFTGRTDPAPVADARIGIGMAAILKGVLLVPVLPLLADADRLRVPWGSAVPEVPIELVYVLLAVWQLSAVAFLLGWHTRIAGGLLTLTVFTVLLLDQQLYSNHLYLLGILCLLLTIADSGAARSLDARRNSASELERESAREPARNRIPAWPVTLLKLQLSIVYGFAAIAKINAVYLSGGTLAADIRGGMIPLPSAMLRWEVLAPAAMLSILVEAYLAGAFWIPRLRRSAVVLGVLLHVGFIVTMPVPLALSVFAVEMISLYALFPMDDAADSDSRAKQQPASTRPLALTSN